MHSFIHSTTDQNRTILGVVVILFVFLFLFREFGILGAIVLLFFSTFGSSVSFTLGRLHCLSNLHGCLVQRFLLLVDQIQIQIFSVFDFDFLCFCDGLFDVGFGFVVELVAIVGNRLFCRLNQGIDFVLGFDELTTLRLASLSAFDSASRTICSISSSESPPELLMTIFCSFPVPLSFALTFKIPSASASISASISKLTSICGTWYSTRSRKNSHEIKVTKTLVVGSYIIYHHISSHIITYSSGLVSLP